MTHVPRKRFGQHFLHDTSVLEAIVDAIAPGEGERLVEIGPGAGALTERLLARVAHLDAVEIDRDLVGRLRARWPASQLTVHEADALSFDFGSLAAAGPIRLAGNLPYNISSPLLLRLVPLASTLIDAHFMLQKEVVARVAAAPGGADYGRLTVMLQAYFDAQRLFDVGPEAFDPPPRVQSSVVRLRPLPAPRVRSAEALAAVTAAGFGQRRKMLRGTLLPWLERHGVDPALPRFALDPTARAETVPVATWALLADALAESRR